MTATTRPVEQSCQQPSVESRLEQVGCQAHRRGEMRLAAVHAV